MHCDEAQELVYDYIDKQLDPSGRTILEEHLSSCQDCRIKVDTLGRTDSLFASLPEIEPPLGFGTRVMAHVREEAIKPSLWQRLLASFRFNVPVQAAAVLLLAVLAVFLYHKESPQEQLAPVSRPEGTGDLVPPLAQGSRSTPTAELADESKLNTQRQGSGDLAQEAQPTPGSGANSPHGSAKPEVGARQDSKKTGEQLAVHYRLVLRLQDGPSAPALTPRSVLSQQELKNLAESRARAIETGQAQSESFSIPREQYETFKTELAAIGYIVSDRTAGSPEAPALTQSSDPLKILVTIEPPSKK